MNASSYQPAISSGQICVSDRLPFSLGVLFQGQTTPRASKQSPPTYHRGPLGSTSFSLPSARHGQQTPRQGSAPPAPAQANKKTGPQKLGGPGAGGGASKATLDAMPPEMRARIERERRARAAEARLRNLGGGSSGS